MDLVIGGSGFIGCWLVEILLRKKRPVRVFDLAPFPADETLQPTEMMAGTILDLKSLKAAVKGCATVYHLAANPQLWHRNPKIFDQVNRQGTQNVIEAVRSANVNCLVYTSTESILAPQAHKGLITEDIQTSMTDMIGPYCRSKFLAEHYVADLAKNGFPAVIVNPTMPIGPCDRNLTPPGKMIRNFLLGKIKGYLDCTLNFVDVRDAAMGHFLAAEHGIPGRRYILAGHNLQIKDFFIRLAAMCHRPPPRFKIPYALALGFSYIEEWYGRLTGREPLSSVTGVRLCRRSLAFDGTQTWQQLGGHIIRPLDDSLGDAIAWHRQKLATEGITV
jgi:dihydroflavonol-4-reductase